MAQNPYDPHYICTHLGEENSIRENYNAVTPPIFATSLHVFEDIGGLLGHQPSPDGDRYIYGRVANPTSHMLEQKLAALEKAEGALCFASGMAAITAAVLHCVKPGGHVVTVKNVYGPARIFFETQLKKFGVSVTFVQGCDPGEFEQAVRPETMLFYLESPTSAVMELQNLREIARIAKGSGIKTAIDNTWATPLYQRPLEMGIDITLHTMSKYIGGHSDIIGGVLCADRETIEGIQFVERELYGGIIGPFEAWLAIRGLRTLPARLAQSGDNALAVAKLLDESGKVRRVNYPGLPSHPQHALATEQMSGSSGLLSFELDGSVEQATRFADHLKSFHKGVSWGGFESLVCMPMYKHSDETAAGLNSHRNLIRLYCGLESKAGLLEDVQAALNDL